MFRSAQKVGERHETLVERVQKITGAGHKRAKLIARDQTVKHNAVIRQETARGLGITQYIWRTSGDEAVRPYHKKLNGTTQSYADPPVTDAYGHRNNAGEDYNCRCVDEPVVDLFAGLGGPDLSGSLRAQGKLGAKPNVPKIERAAPREPVRAPTPAPVRAPAPPRAAPVQDPQLAQLLSEGFSGGIGRLELRPASLEHLRAGKAVHGGSPILKISADGAVRIVDGRHRITLAREAGATSIRARVMIEGKRGGIRQFEERDIPLKPLANNGADQYIGAKAQPTTKPAPEQEPKRAGNGRGVFKVLDVNGLEYGSSSTRLGAERLAGRLNKNVKNRAPFRVIGGFSLGP
jgi:SPP1 gp7 family putative phage head morphogenesis protein